MPIYIDLNSEDPTKKPLVRDEKAISQSIQNILATQPGQKAFQPSFGANLEGHLHDLLTPGSGLAILTEIAEAISQWEKRVRVNFGKSSFEVFPKQQTIVVTVVFSIIGLDNQEFQFTASVES